MMNRFERQLLLPGFGKEGQERLRNSSILVIGAGGLGCPALLYLAAAGVGKIGLVDGDKVALSNLNRQVLYGERDLGRSKAITAGEYFQQKYQDIDWQIYPEFITVANAEELISSYDLVLDGSDNFPTRYLVSDACVLLQKPLVFGAIYQHEGQVSVFNLGKNSCTYRDLFPEMPRADEIPNCSETGVLGVLPGIVGNLMALEAIKVLSGFGKPLANRVLFFNSMDSQTYEIEVSPNPEASGPKTLEEFRALNYELACEGIWQMDWQAVDRAMQSGAVLVDVRELAEIPKYEFGDFLEIPLSKLPSSYSVLENQNPLLIFCQSGIRSQKAALMLKSYYPQKEIYSIRGGIMALEKQ